MAFTTLDELREARNKALAASDFLMLEDSPIREDLREVKITELKLYRSALRNLPQLAEEVGLENIEFPISPV
jgi:hypothetical protein